MHVYDNKWRISSRDIWRATSCSHCLLQAMVLAAKIPKAIEKVKSFEQDLNSKLQIRQGSDFEDLLLDELRSQIGNQLIELPDRATKAQTLEALAQAPMVIAQASLEVAFGDVHLTGFSDLLIREDLVLTNTHSKLNVEPRPDFAASGEVKYTVWDIKFSTKAKDNYKLQVAAYAQALDAMGILSSFESGLVLRDKSINGFELQALRDQLSSKMKPVLEALHGTKPSELIYDENMSWHCDEPSVCKDVYCEFPDLCAFERVRLDMITQLYKLNASHKVWFRSAGLKTVEQIANLDDDFQLPKPKGGYLEPGSLNTYRKWAKVIHDSKLGNKPLMRLTRSPESIAADLPERHPGDLFFDFEWYSPIGSNDELHYLFGITNRANEFTHFDALTFEQEKDAFIACTNYLLGHLEANLGALIYHYNDPEPKRMQKLADRYGILQDEVAQIKSSMFDLLPIVRASMINGFGKLGIKTLEHFYAHQTQDDAGIRGDTEVSDGADSQYQLYLYYEAIHEGNETEADRLWANILEYNKADCVSTLMLLEWLRTDLAQYYIRSFHG